MDSEDNGNSVESEQPSQGPVIEAETIEVAEHAITPQQFIDRYNALCIETGYQIITNPAFIKRDDGTYSIVIQASVGEMPKQ